MKNSKIKISTVTSIIMLFLISCNKKREQHTEFSELSDFKKHTEAINILENNCVSCHAPKKELDTKVAPGLLSLKNHYAKSSKNESEFTTQMVSFLLNPTKETSKMPDAVQKFNLMPNLGMDKSDYQKVASFLFNVNFNNPEWHNHYTTIVNNQKNKIDTTNYLKKGMNIALATKAVLGKNLLNAIKVRGTDKALEFCNIKAIPLTDSMATNQNASIKRVSDKNRNPKNMANTMELKYIADAKSKIKNKEKPTPQIQEIGNKTVGYYPIMTNDLCLKCHGNPNKEIDNKTYEMITQKYPEDKAIGYAANELRGIWVIEMD